jgi:hypothetical protein
VRRDRQVEDLLRLVDDLENENSELQLMLDSANARISKKFDTKEDGIIAEYQNMIKSFRLRISSTNKVINEMSMQITSKDLSDRINKLL